MLPVPPLGRRFCAALALAALVCASGCSDDPADPIVLATDATQGGAGAGPGDVGDVGDLCAPCGSRLDCAIGEACVELDRASDRFCSRACGDPTKRCPSGYICSDVYNLSSPACVPESGQCMRVIP